MVDKKNLNISLQSGKNKDVNKILKAWEDKKDPISTLVCEYIIYGFILDNCKTTKPYVNEIRHNLDNIENPSSGLEKFNEDYLAEFDKILSNEKLSKGITLSSSSDVNWEVKCNQLCKYLIENHKEVAIEVMKNVL